MSSTVKANNFQIGQSATATNNATWYQPASPDGTVRLGVGNAGATTSDVLVANSSGNVGIGTSSPGAKLEVSSATPVALQVTSNTVNGVGVYLNNTYAGGSKWSILSGNVAPSVLSIKDETNNATRIALDSSGNLGLGGASFASGTLVMFIANRSAAPSGTPSGGGILYVESGALKYKGSSGTVTTIANA